MAVENEDGGYDQRLDRLQGLVEEQGKVIADQKARLDAVEGSWVSRMLHAPEEKDRTSRRDLLKRAGVAAAAAIGGMAVLDQPVAAITGSNMVLGNANNAGAVTTLSPTVSTFPGTMLRANATGGGVGINSIASASGSTTTVGISILANASGGAWGLVASAPGGYDLGATGSGRFFQSSLGSGPPGVFSANQETTRDAQGVQWLSNGQGGWYPTQVGGLNVAQYSAVITTQKSLAGSNAATWVDMDATNLHLTITPKFHCQAVVTVNADLWTTAATFNQDIGVRVTSSTVPPGVGLYPTTAGQPEGWKESSGSAAFSPNAAYLETVLPMRAGVIYNLFVVWKSNKPMTGAQSILTGAGPIGGKFSPTRMSVRLVTDAHSNVGALPTPAPAKPKKPGYTK